MSSATFQRLAFASGRIACFGKLTGTTAIYIGPRTGQLRSNM